MTFLRLSLTTLLTLSSEGASGWRFRLPVVTQMATCYSCKRASYTSGSTADSETWCLVGSNDSGVKREVIPLLDQAEVTLRRPVKLVCKEDNTACIASIKRGYSAASRYLKRHAELSLGFTNEVFYPDATDQSVLVRVDLLGHEVA